MRFLIAKPHVYCDVTMFRQETFTSLDARATDFSFDITKRSVPAVFYSGKFIGGVDELKAFKQF